MDPAHAKNETFPRETGFVLLEQRDADVMDFIFKRASKNSKWVGQLDSDAKIRSESGLRHYTHKRVGVFFRWDKETSHLHVYAVGRHGMSNEEYKLNKFEPRTKTKNYSFLIWPLRSTGR